MHIKEQRGGVILEMIWITDLQGALWPGNQRRKEGGKGDTGKGPKVAFTVFC